MDSFDSYIKTINESLSLKNLPRLEAMMSPATFSDFVGNFMIHAISDNCSHVTKNLYHNGHPDLIPTDHYEGNSCQYGDLGIEVKASKHAKGWQGHNPEAIFLLVFTYEIPLDGEFTFTKVMGAQLEKTDWKFYGRNETSRRTPTASVLASGQAKLEENWIWRLYGNTIPLCEE